MAARPMPGGSSRERVDRRARSGSTIFPSICTEVSPMKLTVSMVLLVALAAAGQAMAERSAAVVEKVNWKDFLGRQDLVWDSLPTAWDAGAFLGNGLPRSREAHVPKAGLPITSPIRRRGSRKPARRTSASSRSWLGDSMRPPGKRLVSRPTAGCWPSASAIPIPAIRLPRTRWPPYARRRTLGSINSWPRIGSSGTTTTRPASSPSPTPGWRASIGFRCTSSARPRGPTARRST